MSWEKKEILICVKTYPQYSSKYTETVCTAGILAESKRLVRLYPVPYRYLEGDQRFDKYQWITAEIRKSSEDRPETYIVKDNSIALGEKMPSTAGWRERKKWVLSEQNLFDSLEHLQQQREEKGTSLGIIKPKHILGSKISKKSKSELDEGEKKKRSIMNQLSMFGEKKDLELLPVNIFLKFNCNDKECPGHEISILDWEIAELYRKVCSHPDGEQKVREKIIQDIFDPRRDSYLIMGNMARHRNVFCILGFFWPLQDNQSSLFYSD